MPSKRKNETREEFLKRRRELYLKNIESERERSRRYELDHKEKRRASGKLRKKKYYIKHRDDILSKARDYRAKFPDHSVWSGIMKRCGIQKGAHDFELKAYRDKGITVCTEWRTFSNFHEWAIRNGWRKGLQIDRIDGKKGYSPDNCRIVTAVENIRNRCSTLKIIFNGKLTPLSKAIEIVGNPLMLSYSTIQPRIRHGWGLDKSLTTPVKKI